MLRGNLLKLSQYFITKLPHCILNHPVFLLFQVIETSQYGTLLPIMVIIFSFLIAYSWALVPNLLLWNCLVSGRLKAFAVLCVGGVCVWFHGVTWCLQFKASDWFAPLSVFYVPFKALLPAWGCSCMLISQFEQNTHRSLPKYLVFLIQEGGSFWDGMGEKGRVWICCCFLFLLSSGRWSFFSWDGALMSEMLLCHIIISNF